LKHKVANVGVHPYDPARGQKKPIVQIEAYRLIEHYILTTPLELNGEGISFLEKVSSYEPQDGLNQYKVTYEAFEKLSQEYAIMMESLSD
jgi:hypothetical protein